MLRTESRIGEELFKLVSYSDGQIENAADLSALENALKENPELVNTPFRYILNNGDRKYLAPINYALQHCDLSVIKMLAQHGCEIPADALARVNANPDLLTYLTNSHPHTTTDVNTNTQALASILAANLSEGEKKYWTRKFIQFGLSRLEADEVTLMDIALYNSPQSLSMLCREGEFDINARDAMGDNLLHKLAASVNKPSQLSHAEIIKRIYILKILCISTTAANILGETPEHIINSSELCVYLSTADETIVFLLNKFLKEKHSHVQQATSSFLNSFESKLVDSINDARLLQEEMGRQAALITTIKNKGHQFVGVRRDLRSNFREVKVYQNELITLQNHLQNIIKYGLEDIRVNNALEHLQHLNIEDLIDLNKEQQEGFNKLIKSISAKLPDVRELVKDAGICSRESTKNLTGLYSDLAGIIREVEFVLEDPESSEIMKLAYQMSLGELIGANKFKLQTYKTNIPGALFFTPDLRNKKELEAEELSDENNNPKPKTLPSYLVSSDSSSDSSSDKDDSSSSEDESQHHIRRHR